MLSGHLHLSDTLDHFPAFHPKAGIVLQTIVSYTSQFLFVRSSVQQRNCRGHRVRASVTRVRPLDCTEAVTRVRGGFFLCAIAVLLVALPARGQPATAVTRLLDQRAPICGLVETVARANGLPIAFFTRVIWQESRFQVDAIGPLTRSGDRAEGIAQFMPGTAAERGLFEPFDPREALPKSGAFLAELRSEFGNLGLAAAAYNAGPQRVHDYLAGGRDLPLETRNYVQAITGRPIEDWAEQVRQISDSGKVGETEAAHAPSDCRDVVSLLEHTPDPLPARWQGRKFPSWCKGLRHPDINLCGPVHLAAAMGSSNASAPRSHVHLSRYSAR